MTRYYIDHVTFDRIARVVAQSFSWVQWTTIKGVIDDKTNTELALTHLIPNPVIDPDLSLSIRESSWIINVSHFHPDGIEDPKFIFQ